MATHIVYVSGRLSVLDTITFVDCKAVAINKNQPVWSQLEAKLGGKLASTAGICDRRVQYPGCQG